MNRPSDELKLDFIHIGAARAASTLIAECLTEHPQVCFSKKKETYLFSDNFKKNGQYDLEKYFNKSVRLKVRNTNQEYGDLVYELNSKELKKAYNKTKSTISESIMAIEGVISVDQVEDSHDISR